MPQSFDLDRASAQLHLSEAVVWCTNRQLTATPLENSEIRRRLKLLDQAAELMHQAYLESGNVVGRFLRRDYSKTRKYQQALDLMAQINPASLPSVTKRLRSPELQPSLELSQAQTEQAREQIVQSVVSKRSAFDSDIATPADRSSWCPRPSSQVLAGRKPCRRRGRIRFCGVLRCG
jgi:hypothetical protein